VSVCTNCPAGTYSGVGAINCTDCLAGTWSASGAGTCSTPCGADTCSSPCGVGTYSAAGTSTTCFPCPANTSSAANSTLIMSCTCLAGYIASSDGVACSACGVGTYKPDTGVGVCALCLEGTYKDNEGSGVCSTCPVGTYSATTGRSMCTPCAAGTYSTAVGASLINTCQSLQSCARTTFPWTTTQQNDEFLALLRAKPPVGINILSHYDSVTNTVPDARGLAYDVVLGVSNIPPLNVSNILPFPSASVAFSNLVGNTATMTISGTTGSSGVSNVAWSSRLDPYSVPYNMLGVSPAEVAGVHFANNYDYVGATGVYQGPSTYTLDGVYKGDWFTFTSPACFRMTSSQFTKRPTRPQASPGMYKIYAKNTTLEAWTVVYDQTTILSTSEQVVPINIGDVCYLQYGFVVNQLIGQADILNFYKWVVKGVYSPMPQVVTTSVAAFNAVNNVTSLYGPVGTIWALPTLPPTTYTRCWTTRNSVNTNWLVACFANTSPSFTYVVDQTTITPAPSTAQVPVGTVATTDANYLHSTYVWDVELSSTEMKTVTRAMRKELGGVPDLSPAGTTAVVPISDLRAYYLRFLIALRPSMTPTPTAYEQVCPAGTYLDAATTTGDCTSCAAGTYSTTVGASHPSYCLPCPGSMSSPPGSTLQAACKCGVGYWRTMR
jgi:Tyrosine-protein kinase ephrin type A/B receptor-like